MDLAPLRRLVAGSRRLAVLTGAGCSTESGIPDYRSPQGTLRKRAPMRYAEFVRRPEGRQRYWARSFVGWPRFSEARPNRGHFALAWLERLGRVHGLITQNVDGLHQRAGSERVIDLHGRLSEVVCLQCGTSRSRDELQRELEHLNVGWSSEAVSMAPDGDAEIEPERIGRFRFPACRSCGGTLKPDVVFFGESVPRERVGRAMACVDGCDALLVAGSSLTVWSGYRFVRAAAERGVPVAIVNLGPTRGDPLATLKIEASCGDTLAALVG